MILNTNKFIFPVLDSKNSTKEGTPVYLQQKWSLDLSNLRNNTNEQKCTVQNVSDKMIKITNSAKRRSFPIGGWNNAEIDLENNLVGTLNSKNQEAYDSNLVDKNPIIVYPAIEGRPAMLVADTQWSHPWFLEKYKEDVKNAAELPSLPQRQKIAMYVYFPGDIGEYISSLWSKYDDYDNDDVFMHLLKTGEMFKDSFNNDIVKIGSSTYNDGTTKIVSDFNSDTKNNTFNMLIKENFEGLDEIIDQYIANFNAYSTAVKTVSYRRMSLNHNIDFYFPADSKMTKSDNTLSITWNSNEDVYYSRNHNKIVKIPNDSDELHWSYMYFDDYSNQTLELVIEKQIADDDNLINIKPSAFKDNFWCLTTTDTSGKPLPNVEEVSNIIRHSSAINDLENLSKLSDMQYIEENVKSDDLIDLFNQGWMGQRCTISTKHGLSTKQACFAPAANYVTSNNLPNNRYVMVSNNTIPMAPGILIEQLNDGIRLSTLNDKNETVSVDLKLNNVFYYSGMIACIWSKYKHLDANTICSLMVQ